MAFLVSQRNPKPRRKLPFVRGSFAVLVLATLFTLWYFPGLTFRMVSVSDGVHSWGQRWQTILGVSVTESMNTYSTDAEARTEFDRRIANAETVVERAKNLPSIDDQVVGTFINSLNERRYSIVRLQKNSVYQSYAPSLKYALAFDKFRDRKLTLRTPSNRNRELADL
jgi:hypothetical protein